MRDLTTLRIGGEIELIKPASPEEICTTFSAREHRILGNGSNVFAADRHLGAVLCTKACDRMEVRGTKAYVEAGRMLPSMANRLARAGLGGCEYFASVPGTLGGAIRMNAGRGRQYGRSVADHVDAVHVYDRRSDRVRTFGASECGFSYRRSVFADHPDWIVLSAEMSFTAQPVDVALGRLAERRRFAGVVQDLRHANAGTTVYDSDPGEMAALRGVRRGEAQWSTKTPGWIVNLGSASHADIQELLALPRTGAVEWVVWQ